MAPACMCAGHIAMAIRTLACVCLLSLHQVHAPLPAMHILKTSCRALLLIELLRFCWRVTLDGQSQTYHSHS